MRYALAFGISPEGTVADGIREVCKRNAIRAVFIDRWDDCHLRLYPHVRRFELRHPSVPCTITDADSCKVLLFDRPALPTVARTNAAFQSAEFEALLFGFLTLADPFLARRWWYIACGCAEILQDLNQFCTAVGAPGELARRISDFGLGEAVWYGDHLVHRSPDGIIRHVPIASPAKQIPYVFLRDLSSAGKCGTPCIGRLPPWIALCPELLSRIVAGDESTERDAPLGVELERSVDYENELVIVAHRRDSTAAHLFCRTRANPRHTRFLDLTYALSPVCSEEQFRRYLDATREAAVVFARPSARTATGRAHDDVALSRYGAVLRTLQFRAGMTLNRPAAGHTNISKSAHVAYLASSGLSVPSTLATNDPGAVLPFLRLHKRIVYKSGSRARSAVASFTSADEDRLPRLALCPVLFQEHIDGIDSRVHTVLGRMIGITIHTTQVDYRFATDRRTYQPKDFDPQFGTQLRSLAVASDLALSGTDLKWNRDERRWVVLEINRMPAFDFFDHQAGTDIAGCILDSTKCFAGRYGAGYSSPLEPDPM